MQAMYRRKLIKLKFPLPINEVMYFQNADGVYTNVSPPYGFNVWNGDIVATTSPEERTLTMVRNLITKFFHIHS